MTGNLTDKLIVFSPNRSYHQSITSDDELITSLIAPKAIKRTTFYLPVSNSRSTAHIDLIVIDERQRYRLRHVVFTIWFQGVPVGIYDLATPHLIKDIKFRLFGVGNETLPHHMKTFIGDHKGIPAHSFRLSSENKNQHGMYFIHSGIQQEISQVLESLAVGIFDSLSPHGSSSLLKSTVWWEHYNKAINL